MSIEANLLPNYVNRIECETAEHARGFQPCHNLVSTYSVMLLPPRGISIFLLSAHMLGDYDPCHDLVFT